MARSVLPGGGGRRHGHGGCGGGRHRTRRRSASPSSPPTWRKTRRTSAPDLAEAIARHDVGLDDARPDAVQRRRTVGRRTARENVADLVDDGSFVEYGPVVIAAQRRRRDLADLIARTPADGMIGGIGKVNGHSMVAMSYDYTVLAGTQGTQNHSQEGPPVRAGRAAAPAGGVLHRGRRRPAGRHRPERRQRARLPRVPVLRRAVGTGAHRGRQRRLLLRRQRGHPRLLRRGHRHDRQQHRHGRPGDDRGWRPRRVRPARHRPDRRAARQRRGRHRGARRSRGSGRGQAVPRLLPGAGRTGGRASTSANCAM